MVISSCSNHLALSLSLSGSVLFFLESGGECAGFREKRAQHYNEWRRLQEFRKSCVLTLSLSLSLSLFI